MNPTRTCILTRAPGTPATLLRLALGPELQVAADYAARLPGRGAWIGLSAPLLTTALAKGKLRGALIRALGLKGEEAAALVIPADLPEQIETGLRARALKRLGLEHKAGHLEFGADNIASILVRLPDVMLIHAADAAVDGMRKLRTRGIALQIPVGRDDLSVALGRSHVVHIAIPVRAAAERLVIDISRWLAYVTGSNPLLAAGDNESPAGGQDEGSAHVAQTVNADATNVAVAEDGY